MSITENRVVRGSIHVIVLLAISGAGNAELRDVDESSTVSGRQFDAIGDSVTWGDRIAFEIDDDGTVKPASLEYQGWPELLSRILPSESGTPTLINNLGIPGVELEHILAEHPRKLFNGWSQAPDVLLLIGTNDSNPAIRTPSGLRCKGKECDGTFGGLLRRLVENLLSNGRETIYMGLLPPIWGNNNREIFADPLGADATRNNLVREYNTVITEELVGMPGVRPGPNLFSCFLTPEYNRFSLFTDILHPNTLGQVFVATLWRDAIASGGKDEATGSCPKPVYFLESLDPYRYGHKQNLLAPGDFYYVDEEYVLVDVPAELASGIWVLQANAERNNREQDYLAFDAGESPVTVYIAYDSSGIPPVSASHAFTPVDLSSPLNVSDPAVNDFEFVAASEVTGEVSIGGNKSADNPAAQQSYIVIVVP